MQWKRGLWRLGWVLWAIMAVPTIYIAHQKSIEPDCQWKEGIDYDAIAEKVRGTSEPRPGVKTINVSGIGTAYVPNSLTEEQTEKAISSL